MAPIQLKSRMSQNTECIVYTDHAWFLSYNKAQRLFKKVIMTEAYTEKIYEVLYNSSVSQYCALLCFLVLLGLNEQSIFI